YIWLGFIAGL
nr:Chain C, SARS-CoV-2 Spike-derived peptide S1215-1224 (YIWLGFIAGL) [Severe acute respiratory syndrome coronavirus 2]